MIELVEWFVLIATLPARNSAARMRLWRAAKGLGCATLRDGVYLLPAGEDTSAALRRLADEVRAADGSAEVLHIAADAAQDASFRAQLDRSADFGEILVRLQAAPADTRARELQALRRQIETIAAIDYFPGEAQRQARAALAELEARIAGEPRPIAGRLQRVTTVDFSGRLWATRHHLWIDRMASAWLIRRFIDPAARFLWLATPTDCPADAVGFDFDGATFTHTDALVTFEVLTASFGLDTNPALARLGVLVHYLDVGGAPVAEAAGIAAVLGGLRTATPDDDALVQEASRVFDGLYENYRQESSHD